LQTTHISTQWIHFHKRNVGLSQSFGSMLCHNPWLLSCISPRFLLGFIWVEVSNSWIIFGFDIWSLSAPPISVLEFEIIAKLSRMINIYRYRTSHSITFLLYPHNLSKPHNTWNLQNNYKQHLSYCFKRTFQQLLFIHTTIGYTKLTPYGGEFPYSIGNR